MEQKYTSAATSINASKTPALFRRVDWKPNTMNLDYGGGKFDTATRYLARRRVFNLIYDPFNRSFEHNVRVLGSVRLCGGADTVTLSNVLNVIAEPEVRAQVLTHIRGLLKPGGTLYITVYAGDGSGDGRPTRSGYQMNRPLAWYLSEVRAVFPDAVRKGSLIVATR